MNKLYMQQHHYKGVMTCEALVIGSVSGLVLTAAILSFQVITNRKTSKENPKIENAKVITKDSSSL
jgi:hypothetical protein